MILTLLSWTECYGCRETKQLNSWSICKVLTPMALNILCDWYIVLHSQKRDMYHCLKMMHLYQYHNPLLSNQRPYFGNWNLLYFIVPSFENKHILKVSSNNSFDVSANTFSTVKWFINFVWYCIFLYFWTSALLFWYCVFSVLPKVFQAPVLWTSCLWNLPVQMKVLLVRNFNN